MRSLPKLPAVAAEAARIADSNRHSVIEQAAAGPRRPHRIRALDRRSPWALFAVPLADVQAGDPDRHRLVLSKGHAALALYGALRATGRITAAELETYCGDGSRLAGHPEHVMSGLAAGVKP